MNNNIKGGRVMGDNNKREKLMEVFDNLYKWASTAIMVITIVTGLIVGTAKLLAVEYIGFDSPDEDIVLIDSKIIVFRINDYNYYVKDVDSGFIEATRMDVAPKVVNKRTFVPVRYLANALGVGNDDINWNAPDETAVINGKNQLKLKIGNKTMHVTKPGSQPTGLTMDVAPFIEKPGRVMLPARYVAEGLDFKVDWNDTYKIVVAYPEYMEKPEINDIIDYINQLNKPTTSLSTLTPQEIAYVWSEVNRLKQLAPKNTDAQFKSNPSVLSDKSYNELVEYIRKEYPYVKFDRSLLGTKPGYFDNEQEFLLGIDTKDNHVVGLSVDLVSDGQGIVAKAQLEVDLTDLADFLKEKYKR